MRVPQLEAERTLKLETLKDKTGSISAKSLLEALYMSVIDALTEEEQLTYAQFLLRLMHREIDVHPFYQSKVPQPAATEIMGKLESCYARLPKQVFNMRLSLATSLAMKYIAERNRLVKSKDNPYRDERSLWKEMITAVESLFQLPYPVTF